MQFLRLEMQRWIQIRNADGTHDHCERQFMPFFINADSPPTQGLPSCNVLCSLSQSCDWCTHLVHWVRALPKKHHGIVIENTLAFMQFEHNWFRLNKNSKCTLSDSCLRSNTWLSSQLVKNCMNANVYWAQCVWKPWFGVEKSKDEPPLWRMRHAEGIHEQCFEWRQWEHRNFIWK